jgi:hypothetical protein
MSLSQENVLVNGNDTDADGIKDTADDSVPGETDTVRVKAGLPDDASDKDRFIVDRQGEGVITVWKSPGKSGGQVSLPATCSKTDFPEVFYVEGVKTGEGGLKFTHVTEQGTEICSRTLTFTVSDLDLDIDSDNSNGFTTLFGTDYEDSTEETEPKYVFVGAGDYDSNCVSDSADGYDYQPGRGDRFVPLRITFPKALDKIKNECRIRFDTNSLSKTN